jgi:acetate kinase
MKVLVLNCGSSTVKFELIDTDAELIGENAPFIRSASCERLGFFGIDIDREANARVSGTEGVISAAGSRVKVCVIPTNEELLIARDSVRTVLGIPHPS